MSFRRQRWGPTKRSEGLRRRRASRRGLGQVRAEARKGEEKRQGRETEVDKGEGLDIEKERGALYLSERSTVR